MLSPKIQMSSEVPEQIPPHAAEIPRMVTRDVQQQHVDNPENSGEKFSSTPEPSKDDSLESSAENSASFLQLENKSFLGRMSDAGKKIVGEAYSTIARATGADVLIGKLQIAGSQYWIDRNEEKVVGLKSKMDGFDLKSGALDQSKKQLSSAIEDLKAQQIPGFESLQLKLKEIDQEKTELQNKKDRIQSKLEARKNQIGLFTNERDGIVNEVVSRYDENLAPIEKELEGLQVNRDQVDLLVTVAEVRLREQSEKLSEIEKSKIKIEGALRGTGMSEGDIKEFVAVKALDGQLTEGRQNIKKEREAMLQKKAKINRKIATVDAKANIYRDKREKLLRIKEGRPLKIDVKPRERGIGFRGEEEIEAHSRVEGSETEQVDEEALSGGEPEKGVETVIEKKDRLKTGELISNWNGYLQDQYRDDKKQISGELIDLKDFLKATRMSENYVLDFKDFKNILGKYYKLRKISPDKFSRHIDGYLKVITKA